VGKIPAAEDWLQVGKIAAASIIMATSEWRKSHQRGVWIDGIGWMCCIGWMYDIG